ncbi:hypothetical protein ACVBEJ_14330 [Porticoccus sp. GXU_MW_L64]
MKLTQLKTHYTPEEAHSVLSLLDELRDTLWNAYGPDIVEHYQQQHGQSPPCGPQDRSTLTDWEDDIIPF